MSQNETTTRLADICPIPLIPRTARPLGRRILQVIRRLHLYAGLFMIPWIALYAFTGLLFNHGLWLPEHSSIAFGTEVTRGTPLEELADAATLADEVIAVLRERAQANGKPSDLQLVEPEQAAFQGDDLAIVKNIAEGVEHEFILKRSGGGVVRSRPNSNPGSSSFDCDEGIFGREAPSQRIQQAVPVISERLGLPAGQTSVEFMPELVFYAEADGIKWRFLYDPRTGRVRSKPVDAAPEKSSIRFFKELHFTAGYPSQPGTSRWFWAVAVDATVLSMFFWALSGIFMWWQIKAVRVSGLAVLMASAALATTLMLGMHRLLMF